MKGYTIFIQPTDGSPMHRVDCPFAADADRFAKWVHRATGAAAQIYNERSFAIRATFGDFDEDQV